MTSPTGWRVQAHWLDGDRPRSYAPVHAGTRDEALRIADEMADTLSHFVGLEIRIEQDDGTP